MEVLRYGRGSPRFRSGLLEKSVVVVEESAKKEERPTD
jgi:hypothetical protein